MSHPDEGSAAVDFALVGSLVTLLFLAVVQLALVLHVRNTVTDCAAEGARYGARADRDPGLAVPRTRELVASELSGGYARRITGLSAEVMSVDGVRVVEVRLTVPLPLVGLAGPSGALTVRGHALLEQR